MKYLIPICLLFALNTLKSQSLWVKGYLGITREPQLTLVRSLDPRFIYVQDVNESRLFAMPAIAYELNKKSFLELGVTWGTKNNPSNFAVLYIPPNDSLAGINLGDSRFSRFGVQLDYNYRFSKYENNRWQTFIGVAMNFHQSSFDFTSKLPYVSSRTTDYYGAKIGIVPRAQYRWTNNLLLDISMALFVLDAERQKDSVTGATGPFSSNILRIDGVNGYYFRVGLAWKIAGKTESNSTSD